MHYDSAFHAAKYINIANRDGSCTTGEKKTKTNKTKKPQTNKKHKQQQQQIKTNKQKAKHQTKQKGLVNFIDNLCNTESWFIIRTISVNGRDLCNTTVGHITINGLNPPT